MNVSMPKFSWSWFSIPALLLFWVMIVMFMDSQRSTQLNKKTGETEYSQPRVIASPLEVLDAFLTWSRPQYETKTETKTTKGPDGKPLTREVVVVTKTPQKVRYDQKQSSSDVTLRQSWWTLGSIGPHLWQSFIEVAIGFSIACIVAIILGFWAGFSKGFREFITPLNGIFMSIPAIAWAPMMITVFPNPLVAIVVVVYIAAVSPMIISIMEGILTITGQEVRAARALGCKTKQLFIHVYIPASLPFITSGMRIGFSQAWRALVAAEIIGGVGRGLGQVVDLSSQVGDAQSMMLAIALIGFLSYLFERLIFRRMEKHYEVWRLN